MAIPISETVVEFGGGFYKITKVAYTGNATTFLFDQNATQVASIEPASPPAATIGSGDSNFEKTVTLAGGSAAGTVTVITAHNGPPAGVKPSSRA